ncbi:hypothetical protein B566_EDAN009196 [Ephemera danica]|nr:hypothetical protein B566_EDAN009196 [Ephemera danica]
MTYLKSWEEFEKAAERLYLQNPKKFRFLPPFSSLPALPARYTIKYVHSKGILCLKMTDDIACIQYKTEILQDVRKMDKFLNNLMRHMASKES